MVSRPLNFFTANIQQGTQKRTQIGYTYTMCTIDMLIQAAFIRYGDLFEHPTIVTKNKASTTGNNLYYQV